MAAGHERAFQWAYSEVFTGNTRFDDLTQGELDEFVAKIYNRTKKVLGWFTPVGIFQELCPEGSTG